jgi:hypothetical protein
MLEVLSKTRHKTKSDIIKEALELLFRSDELEQSSYELGRAVLDIYRLPGTVYIENVFPRAR